MSTAVPESSDSVLTILIRRAEVCVGGEWGWGKERSTNVKTKQTSCSAEQKKDTISSIAGTELERERVRGTESLLCAIMRAQCWNNSTSAFNYQFSALQSISNDRFH